MSIKLPPIETVNLRVVEPTNSKVTITSVELRVTDSLVCPNCGAKEVEDETAPVREWVFNIRANRVCDKLGKWWSQCMKCAQNDRTKGWFCDGQYPARREP